MWVFILRDLARTTTILTLFMHLCRLVLPKPTDDNVREDENQLDRRPIINFVDGRLTQQQIDKLIDNL